MDSTQLMTIAERRMKSAKVSDKKKHSNSETEIQATVASTTNTKTNKMNNTGMSHKTHTSSYYHVIGCNRK